MDLSPFRNLRSPCNGSVLVPRHVRAQRVPQLREGVRSIFPAMAPSAPGKERLPENGPDPGCQIRSSAPVYCTCWLIVQSALLIGCNPSSNLPGPSGTVSGRAVYQQKPVPEGSTVVFVHRETGIIGTGVTDATGAFKILMRERPNVLVGEYSIGIRPPGEPDENISDLRKAAPAAWKLVPQKYWSHDTSGEVFVVKTGANECLLDLRE